jgi:hypothetical protein
MGKVSSKDGLDLCGGKDPDGNPFGLSNRISGILLARRCLA